MKTKGFHICWDRHQCLRAGRFLVVLVVAIVLWPQNATGQHPTVPKLTLSQVEQLVSSKVPDSTMRAQIQKRGLSFAPTPAILGSLRAKGAGPLTIAVIEALLPNGAPSAKTQFTTGNGGPYPIKVEGKYGFIDRSGTIVIIPQFDAASRFADGLAAVRIGTKFGYVNTGGEVVIAPQFEAVEDFSEGRAVFQAGGKFGYIDKNGLVKISAQFDAAEDFHNGRAIVKLCCGSGWRGLGRKAGYLGSDRYGFINLEGKLIGHREFLYVPLEGSFWRFLGARFARPAEDHALVRTTDDRVSIMDSYGDVVIVDKAKVDEIGDFGFGDGLAAAATGGKWGYLDTSGRWAIAPRFEEADGFKDGLARVRVAGQFGLIDRKGNFVVRPLFERIWTVSEGFAITEEGIGTVPGCPTCGMFGYVNTTNQVRVGVNDAYIVQQANPNGTSPTLLCLLVRGWQR